jgi:hypothetical protein
VEKRICLSDVPIIFQVAQPIFAQLLKAGSSFAAITHVCLRKRELPSLERNQTRGETTFDNGSPLSLSTVQIATFALPPEADAQSGRVQK